MTKSKRDALQHSINELITKHGHNNPELLRDLVALSQELDDVSKRSPFDYARYAYIALRIGQLAKWIHDHLPIP